MKKHLLIIFLLFALCLSACNSTGNDPTEAIHNTEATETNPVQQMQLPLPEETTSFVFSSGAGGWSSVILLNRDGTFTGHYSDWDAGVYYVCDFSGKFTDIEKANDYTYKMTLTDLTSQMEIGQEWTEDDIRYIASVPLGLVDQLNDRKCTEFILYLPDAPVAQLNADFVSWSPVRDTYESSPNATLSWYGIQNVTTNDGFFYGSHSN